MKVLIEEELCIGCAVCEQLCEKVFVMDGSLAIVKTEVVPVDLEESCRSAINSCPVQAIRISG